MSVNCRRWYTLPRNIPVLFLAGLCCAAPIQWTDLTESSRGLAIQLGFRQDSFRDQVRAIEQRTADRLREGELDHLVFYMLQSRAFTTAPPIEPARSSANEADVNRRIQDLVRALRQPRGERQQYFAALLSADSTTASVLREEYERVIRFLYRKEAECPASDRPQECIAELYQHRGHSSDTSPDSSQTVLAALDWIREHAPRKIGRVLVIGPGADFAPRSGFTDTDAIRVYQPQRLKNALRANVDCIDINPRVLRSAAGACDAVRRMNVITDRPEPAAVYDLVVATNVLLYMNARELLLAFTNIRDMLAPDGLFVHNDARFEAQLFGKAGGLPAIHFGTVTLDEHRNPVLTDRFIIHQAR